MWGYRGDDEILGRKVVDLWQDPVKAQRHMEELLEGGSSEGVLEGKTESGEEVSISFKAWQIRDPLGRAVALCASFKEGKSEGSDEPDFFSRSDEKLLPPPGKRNNLQLHT